MESVSKRLESFTGTKLPLPPTQWADAPGWTRYNPADGTSAAVPAPLEETVCFDVETCVRDGQRPVMGKKMAAIVNTGVVKC